jgi:hypothetical protein
VVLADLLGWRGLFIDAEADEFEHLQSKYRWTPVTTRRTMVTSDNVQTMFAEAGVPEEPDVLSIDIDGGDYWIRKAITAYCPRLVIVEYNGGLDPAQRRVVPASFPGWDRTRYYGASVGALKALAEAKGYRFVHTEVSGSNAFFVRADLSGTWPLDAVVHGPNYFLLHPEDPAQRTYEADPPVR